MARTSVDLCRCPIGAPPHGASTGQPWSDPRSNPLGDVVATIKKLEADYRALGLDSCASGCRPSEGDYCGGPCMDKAGF